MSKRLYAIGYFLPILASFCKISKNLLVIESSAAVTYSARKYDQTITKKVFVHKHLTF